MRLDTLNKTVAEVEVEYLGQTLKVGYFPAATTPALMERISAEAKRAAADTENESAGLDLMGRMLEPVLAWWDLYATEEDEQLGNRLPTDAATIKDLPIALTGAVQEAIQRAQKPEGSRG